MGKGSIRRPENYARLTENWDAIQWHTADVRVCRRCGGTRYITLHNAITNVTQTVPCVTCNEDEYRKTLDPEDR